MWVLGRNAEALRDAQAAVDLLSGAGDLVWEARALHWRAAAYLALGDIERADRDYARVETLWVPVRPASGVRVRAPGTRGSGARPRRSPHRARPPRRCPRACSTSWGSSRPSCSSTSARCCSRQAWPGTPCARSTRRCPRSRGTTARRRGAPSCCIPPPSPPPRRATSASRSSRSADALRLFRRQQRPWWAARAELVLLLCRFAEGEDRSAALLQAARRVTARLDELDAARAVDAHLLTGRLALAQGRRDEADRHLRSAAGARHRGQLRTRSAGWLAQATWCEAEGPLAGNAGRVRPRPGSARPAPADARSHRAAHAGHRPGRGAGGNGIAPRGPPGRRPVVPGVERALAGHGAPRHPGAPAPGQRPGGRPRRPAQCRRPPRPAPRTVAQRHPRCSGNAVGSRPPCASASCTPRRWRPAMPNPSSLADLLETAGGDRPAGAHRRRRTAVRHRGHRGAAAPGARGPDTGGYSLAGSCAVRAEARGHPAAGSTGSTWPKSAGDSR